MSNENDKFLDDPYEIARYIKNAKKSTPVKVYINGSLDRETFKDFKGFGSGEFWILFGEYEIISQYINNNKEKIHDYLIESDRRNSAIPMLDIKNLEARIEPGAIIRDKVKIDKNAVIMMGAVINIGAEIGENSMIDMNAVIGARAKIGKNTHIGAGSVIAGVLEPPSSVPVIIDNGVVVGANAVVLEGVHVGEKAVVAAGSVVIEDVPPGFVVAGVPAKIVKAVDDRTKGKTKLLDDLRG